MDTNALLLTFAISKASKAAAGAVAAITDTKQMAFIAAILLLTEWPAATTTMALA